MTTKHPIHPAGIAATVDAIMAGARARFGHDAFRMELPTLPTAAELDAVRNATSRDDRAEKAKAAKAKAWAVMQHLMNTANVRPGGQMKASEARDYDRAEAVFDEMQGIYDANHVDRRGVVAPAAREEDRYRDGVPLTRNQTFTGAMRAMGQISAQDDDEPLSLGKYLRGALTGRWDDADREKQVMAALSGASTGAGGILIPTLLSSQMIDLARNRTRVLQAGARIVPMANRKVTVPRWASDPTPEWRGENEPFAEDDATLGSVELNAKGLGVLTKVSLELLEDTDIEGELEASFARSFALAVDLAALYGDPAVDDDSPLGVKNHPDVTKTPLAANGASPTWAALVNAVGRLRDLNEEPTAQIMSDRSARTLALLTGGDGQYVAAPSYLDGVQRLTTGQVPNNLTVGTGTDTSDVFTADWSQMLVGVRSELRIFPLRERFLPDNGQIGLVAHWRGDVALARPKAFDVVSGVKA